MAYILLFHSILGLRPAEREIAAAFSADGHAVALPDLYDGRTTEDYKDGFRLKDEIGDAAILERARDALAAAPDDAVLAGVSYGAFLIGEFWGERPRMPAALLFAGGAGWARGLRGGLPVQAHIARPDPFDDEHVFTDWAATNPGVALEMHRYDGVGHYFLDRSLPDYDASATKLCLERSREFLRRL